MPFENSKDALVEGRWLDALGGGDARALGGLFELYGERIYRF